MTLLNFINTYAIGICVFLAISSIVFIIYGHYNREQVQQALKKEFIKLPATTIDWWSISHAVLYAIFGLLIPDRHLAFFTLGACFEVFEDMLSSNSTTQLTDCSNKDGVMCMFSIDDDYWYAKWDDIFVNLLGYTVGSSIRTTLL